MKIALYFHLKNYQNVFLFLTYLVSMVNLSGVHAKSHARANVTSVDQFITWIYNEAPMGLYLPAKIENPLPIVMFLHGCRNDPVNRYLWIISKLNEIEPCAVFIPTAPETQNTPYPCADWGGTYDSNLRPQMINALTELDSLIEQYDFDTKRQYLYGESMGGEGVFRLLMDLPTRFAGAVDVGGYTPNKGASKMAETPLWICIGARDEQSPVDSSRAIYHAIVSAGGTRVKYTEYSGLRHVAAIEKARDEPEILEWLLAQYRPTSIIKQTEIKNNPLIPDDLFICNRGNLRFSSPLSPETIITLCNLNGQIIFKSSTHKKSVTLPASIADCMVLWNISNSQFSISGKIPLW